MTHTVSGGDYECVPASYVRINVTDNDTKGVTLSESALMIDEGGTGTYTVQLDSEPTGNTGTVIVTINDPTDNTHVTTAPKFLTFTIRTIGTTRRPSRSRPVKKKTRATTGPL